MGQSQGVSGQGRSSWSGSITRMDLDQDQDQDQGLDQDREQDQSDDHGMYRVQEKVEDKDQAEGKYKIPCEDNKQDQYNDQRHGTVMTIIDRKKSLEANTSTPVAKSVKIEYVSSFSIKPLIDFFNRAFRRDTSSNESESRPAEECVTAPSVSSDEADEAEDLSDSLSNSGSFVSCCSRFDLSDTDSLYYSLDEISCSSDTEEDHEMKLERLPKDYSEHKTDEVLSSKHEDEGLLADYSQLQPDEQEEFKGAILEKKKLLEKEFNTEKQNEYSGTIILPSTTSDENMDDNADCVVSLHIKGGTATDNDKPKEVNKIIDARSYGGTFISHEDLENGYSEHGSNIIIETCHSQNEDQSDSEIIINKREIESHFSMNDKITVVEKIISCQEEHDFHTKKLSEELTNNEAWGNVMLMSTGIFEENTVDAKDTLNPYRAKVNINNTEKSLTPCIHRDGKTSQNIDYEQESNIINETSHFQNEDKSESEMVISSCELEPQIFMNDKISFVEEIISIHGDHDFHPKNIFKESLYSDDREDVKNLFNELLEPSSDDAEETSQSFCEKGDNKGREEHLTQNVRSNENKTFGITDFECGSNTNFGGEIFEKDYKISVVNEAMNTLRVCSERIMTTDMDENMTLNTVNDVECETSILHPIQTNDDTSSSCHKKCDELEDTYQEMTNDIEIYKYETVEVVSNNKITTKTNEDECNTIVEQSKTIEGPCCIPTSDDEMDCCTFNNEKVMHVKEVSEHLASNINPDEVPFQVQQEIKVSDHLLHAEGTHDKDFNKMHCKEKNRNMPVDNKNQVSKQRMEHPSFNKKNSDMTNSWDVMNSNMNLERSEKSNINITNADNSNVLTNPNSEDHVNGNSRQEIVEYHEEPTMVEDALDHDCQYSGSRMKFIIDEAPLKGIDEETINKESISKSCHLVVTLSPADITKFEQNNKVLDESVPPDCLVKASDFEVHQVSKSSSTGQEIAETQMEYEENKSNPLKKDLCDESKEDIYHYKTIVSQNKNELVENQDDANKNHLYTTFNSQNTTLILRNEEKEHIRNNHKGISQKYTEEDEGTIVKQVNLHGEIPSHIKSTSNMNSAFQESDDIEYISEFEISKNQITSDLKEDHSKVLPDLIKSMIHPEEKVQNHSEFDKSFSNLKNVQSEYREIENYKTNKHNNMNISGDDKFMNEKIQRDIGQTNAHHYNEGTQIETQYGSQIEDVTNTYNGESDFSQNDENSLQIIESIHETDNEERREPCLQNLFPDVVKDQFLEGNSKLISEELEYLLLDGELQRQDSELSNTHHLYQKIENNSSFTIIHGDSINNNEVSENETIEFAKGGQLANFDNNNETSLNSSLEFLQMNLTTDLQSNQEGDLKCMFNDKSYKIKPQRDCNSACSTSSSLTDSEPTFRRRYSKKSFSEPAWNKKPWNYGSRRSLGSTSSSMNHSIHHDFCREESEDKTQNDEENKFYKKPWNFGAGTRKDATASSIKLFSEPEENVHGKHLERRRSSESAKSTTVTEFDKKPWNYGAWRDRRSLSTFTYFARSCQADETFSKRKSISQVARRATIAQFDRKPWNYGAGGSKYKKLFDFFDSKRNVC